MAIQTSSCVKKLYKSLTVGFINIHETKLSFDRFEILRTKALPFDCVHRTAVVSTVQWRSSNRFDIPVPRQKVGQLIIINVMIGTNQRKQQCALWYKCNHVIAIAQCMKRNCKS
jgi:hypothetical protein